MTLEQHPRREMRMILSGAVAFIAFLALVFIGYAYLVVENGRGLTDWILILPTAVIGVIALIFAGIDDVAKAFASSRATGKRDDTKKHTGHEGHTDFFLMLLVVAYAVLMPWLGFDVGTAVFIALALLVQGERRYWLIALVAVVGAQSLVFVFHDLLRIRIPTLIM